MAGAGQSVNDILDQLDELADAQDEVCVGDVIDAFGNRSYGPFLLVPALIGVSPVGGIPGVPTFLAATILLVAAQIACGRRHLWLPGMIERRAVDADRLGTATDKLRGVAKWLDRWFKGRFERFTGTKAGRIAAAIVVVLCAAVPPLELLPFAVILPMAVIAAFGIALTVRDGALMLIAFAGSLAAFAVLAANFIG